MTDVDAYYEGTDFYCDVALKNKDQLEIVYEDEHAVGFHHTRPHWPVHLVVVPKKHIPSLTNLDGNEAELHFVIKAVRQVADEVERTQGAAKVLTNLGEYQDSKHLHFHVVCGEELS